jgi:hypothetical protein
MMRNSRATVVHVDFQKSATWHNSKVGDGKRNERQTAIGSFGLTLDRGEKKMSGLLRLQTNRIKEEEDENR